MLTMGDSAIAASVVSESLVNSRAHLCAQWEITGGEAARNLAREIGGSDPHSTAI